jgi:hypothetical protein
MPLAKVSLGGSLLLGSLRRIDLRNHPPNAPRFAPFEDLDRRSPIERGIGSLHPLAEFVDDLDVCVPVNRTDLERSRIFRAGDREVGPSDRGWRPRPHGSPRRGR